MQDKGYERSDLIISALSNQVANLSRQLAERDAIITEQQIELDKIRKEQIEEMDENAE